MNRCAKAITTSVARESLYADEERGRIEWTSNVVLSLRTEDATCTDRFAVPNGTVDGFVRFAVVREASP